MSRLEWRSLDDDELSRMRLYLEDLKCVHTSNSMSDADYEAKEEVISYNFRDDNDIRSIMCNKVIIGTNSNWFSCYPKHNCFNTEWDLYKFDINGDYVYTSDYSNDILRNCPFLYMKIFKINSREFFQPRRKYFYWITITGKSRIDVNDDNVKAMYTLFKEFYTNEKWVRYHNVIWNIESGKHPEKPNLHHHALIIFNTTNKNFKRDISSRFKKAFGSVDYDEHYFTSAFQMDIWNEKRLYLNNTDKSVEHQNYEDLKILEILE